MSQFDLYAAYYDLLYKDKNYGDEVDYLSSLIKKHNGNNASTLLELGCGTGGHAQHFAKRGWQVHGIDLSQQMVDSAIQLKEEAEDISHQMTFEVGDVRTYNANKQYDVVMSLFHVMSYQTSNEDLVSAFAATQANLKKGGLFIFDFWYGPAVLTDRPKNADKVVENEQVMVHRKTLSDMKINENCVEVNFDISIKSKLVDKEEKNIAEKHTMRYWFLPELEYLLANSGIDLIGAYQWMTEEPMTDDSWYGCVVGRAK